MFKSFVLLASVSAPLFLTGCGKSCESIQEEMEAISRDLQEDPGSVFDRADELEELGAQLVEMQCFG